MLNQAPEQPQIPIIPVPQAPVVPTPPVLNPDLQQNNNVVKQPVIAQESKQVVQQVEPQIPPSQAVLLVEDDLFLSSLMKMKLEQAGLPVVLAVDGEQAIELAEKYIPRVVLLDLILPKKSGFEVLEAIRNNPQIGNIPIVILSNLGQDSDVSKGKDLGAIEYFIKAKTSIDDLVNKVQGFLQGQKLS